MGRTYLLKSSSGRSPLTDEKCPACCVMIGRDRRKWANQGKTATHIGIREAEDWFRPIDLAKECDIYISSRSGSRKGNSYCFVDIPKKTPLKIDHETINQKD
ncbi:hypothetical protein TNCV_2966591 [Trichonephila clavipes]|nr:hypothetical protein TNCV_2966591 [Trichonephila clavipes]